jgi:predicted ATPase
VTFGILNFKSIASAEIEPKRLTIVAGSNSSGKSSLLQSLLFAAQSFGEPNPVINGDLVRLGEANDVIRDGMEETTLEFRYREFQPQEDSEKAKEIPRAWRLTLTARDSGRSLAASEFSLWRYGICIFRATTEDSPKDLARSEEEFTLKLEDPKAFNLPENSYLIVAGITPTRIAYEADDQKLKAEFEQALETGRTPRLPLEEVLRIARVNASDDVVAARLTEMINRFSHGDMRPVEDSDRDLLFDAFREVVAPGGWISEPIAGSGRGRPYWRVREDEAEGLNVAVLAHDISRGAEHVERLSAAIIYLGPLRDDPRVAYPLGHTVRALPVGEKGEFTAAYLRENRGVRLSFGRPDGSETSGTLASAVNQWCEYLGIADRIEVSTQGKLGHVLGLRVGGHERDPTAIGVGASQLLPVVVLVLGAPEGSVVLLEQPELHLHPGVQSRLADFLARARRNIRIVVETHSEYLLTRFRLRIAEGELDPNELAVLFATQQPDDDSEVLHTQFEHLTLDELGDFNRWPKDFFDSLDQDSVDLAQAVARKLEVGTPQSE